MEWEDVARDQHGLITRVQLREKLLSANQIEWMTRSKKLVRKYPGVYALPAALKTWEFEATAALLSAGDGAALSHRAAAHAHAIEGIDYEGQITVLVPYERNVRTNGFEAFRTRTRIPTTQVNKMTVTSLARTFVDLAPVISDVELERALDFAVRRRESTDWLFSYLGELQEWKHGNVARLRELAEMRRDGAMDSILEVDIWRILREYGFPPFVKRYIVLDENGKYVLRCDFAWPHLKVVLHADSLRHHQSPKQMARDAEQRAKLDELGWKQLVVVRPMLKENKWIPHLRRLLDQPVL